MINVSAIRGALGGAAGYKPVRFRVMNDPDIGGDFLEVDFCNVVLEDGALVIEGEINIVEDAEEPERYAWVIPFIGQRFIACAILCDHCFEDGGTSQHFAMQKAREAEMLPKEAKLDFECREEWPDGGVQPVVGAFQPYVCCRCGWPEKKE